MIAVEIDEASAVPPFEQLRVQLDAAIRSGTLPLGVQLPPIRQLAADLQLAPNTVARAYRELEAAGLVVTQGRRGTRVAEGWLSKPETTPVAVESAITAYLSTMRQLGYSREAAVHELRVAIEQWLPAPG